MQGTYTSNGTPEHLLDKHDYSVVIVSNPFNKWWAAYATGKAFQSHTIASFYHDAKTEVDYITRGLLSTIRGLDPNRCEDVRNFTGENKFRIRVLSTKRPFVEQIARFQAGLEVEGTIISPALVNRLSEDVAKRNIVLDPFFLSGHSSKVRFCLNFANRMLRDHDPEDIGIMKNTYQIPENVFAEDDHALVTA